MIKKLSLALIAILVVVGYSLGYIADYLENEKLAGLAGIVKPYSFLLIVFGAVVAYTPHARWKKIAIGFAFLFASYAVITNKTVEFADNFPALALTILGAVLMLTLPKMQLWKKHPALELEVKTIMTTGDANPEANLTALGGKELFTREIDAALLRGEIDIAVHSLKDVPGIISDEISIAAVLKRADPRDVILGADSIADLPQGAKLGTSSPRRSIQVKALRPDVEIVYFRGNVPTRLEKLKNKVVDATLLAKAGLDRLQIESGGKTVETSEIIPAVGQGIIAIATRESDVETKQIVASINHEESYIRAICERAIIATYGGNCHTPIAAHAVVNGHEIEVKAIVANDNGSEIYRTSAKAKTSEAKQLGEKIGAELLQKIGK